VVVHRHADTAVAELAHRLVEELGRLDPVRVRHCAREACDLLFYDTTRSRTQRWHSESPCGNRERQDRFAARSAGPNQRADRQRRGRDRPDEETVARP
jgi:predicted RNA-binding Zn ribbon-like protein